MYHLSPDEVEQQETEMEDALLWLSENDYEVNAQNIHVLTEYPVTDCQEWLEAIQ